MCNDHGNNIPYSAYLDAFSQTRVLIVFPRAAPNLEPRGNIWPTDIAPAVRQTDDGAEYPTAMGIPARPTERRADDFYQRFAEEIVPDIWVIVSVWTTYDRLWQRFDNRQ